MRERGIAGDAFGQKDRAVNRQILEELLRSLVRVEHAQLQVENGLARDREVEVSGFDNARVHRSDRNLENALAERRTVHMPLAFEGRQLFAERESLCAADERRASCRAARHGADWDVRRARDRTSR